MRELEDILKDYEDTRISFKDFSNSGDSNKDTLLEFQHRFVDLKADLRYWHTKMLKASEMRSDKGATAVKMRLACSMVKGEYVFKDGETPMYEKPPTMTNADKYAAATKEYREFLDQRTMYKESYTNVADTREDIGSYITLIRDRHNK